MMIEHQEAEILTWEVNPNPNPNVKIGLDAHVKWAGLLDCDELEVEVEVEVLCFL